MEEKTASAPSETTEAKLQKQEKKSVIFIVALSAVLLLGVVWSMTRAAKEQYRSELDATYESLANSMFAVRNLISFEDSLQSSYESFDLREAKIYTDVAKTYFDYTGVTKASVNDYAYRMGDCEIFYYPDEGAEIVSDNAETFPLDDEQLRTLKSAGVLEVEERNYTATRVGAGWLCFRWEDAAQLYSVDFARILETCPSELCVIDNVTGEVIAGSGTEDYDFLNESMVTLDAARTGYEKEGVQAGFYGGESALSGGVYFVKVQMIDRYSIFAYTPLRSVMSNALRTVAPEFALMLKNGKGRNEKADMEREAAILV